VITTTPQSVVIFGGGPAGLATAFLLTRHGYRVTVIDRPFLIGSIGTRDNLSDTLEPFTILGCHRATRSLLGSLYPDPQQPSETEIPLEFQLLDNSLVHYPRTSFPAPLHTWVNLLTFAGIPWKERWRLASWVEQLWEGDEQLPADLEQRTADEWLRLCEENDVPVDLCLTPAQSAELEQNVARGFFKNPANGQSGSFLLQGQ